MLDVLALTLYINGFILRIIHQSLPSICPKCLYVARIVLCFSLLISILRVLQLLSINHILGPKIYMIGGLVSKTRWPLICKKIELSSTFYRMQLRATRTKRIAKRSRLRHKIFPSFLLNSKLMNFWCLK